MATYGGNSIIMDSSYASTGNISSSNGNIGGGQVIYTNTDTYYKVFRFVGFWANLNSTMSVVMGIQRLGVNNGNWFTQGSVILSGDETAANEERGLRTPEFRDPAAVLYSTQSFAGCTDYTWGGQFILPVNSRIVTISGSCRDGATLRFTYDVFKFYNS